MKVFIRVTPAKGVTATSSALPPYPPVCLISCFLGASCEPVPSLTGAPRIKPQSGLSYLLSLLVWAQQS